MQATLREQQPPVATLLSWTHSIINECKYLQIIPTGGKNKSVFLTGVNLTFYVVVFTVGSETQHGNMYCARVQTPRTHSGGGHNECSATCSLNDLIPLNKTSLKTQIASVSRYERLQVNSLTSTIAKLASDSRAQQRLSTSASGETEYFLLNSFIFSRTFVQLLIHPGHLEFKLVRAS